MKITRNIFESQRQPRFGSRNPEPMRLAFWEYMVRSAEDARQKEEWSTQRNPKSLGHTPTEARIYFRQEGDYSKGPIWTFDRIGASRTAHPDGRLICIAGEHEDRYDPDFYIYNDVIIFNQNGSIEIYGYPKDVFPPTDFHSATLLGNRVLIIGRTGNAAERHMGTTPVFALDLTDYHIEELPSHGELPGWIFRHEADVSHGIITIRGGEILEDQEGKQRLRRNFDDFAYEVETGLWKRLTNRKWQEFLISSTDGKIFLKRLPFTCGPPEDAPWMNPLREILQSDAFIFVSSQALLPKSFAYDTIASESEEDEPESRIIVAGIPLSIRINGYAIEIIIEGEMPPSLASKLVKDIQESIEDDTGHPLVVERKS